MTDIPIPDYDATDETAENNARRDEARRKREDAETVKRLMSHKNGRAWVYRFLDKCHIHNTPFVPGDPYTSAFHAGEENAGKRLFHDVIDACADLYLVMLAEAKKEEERLAAAAIDTDKTRQAEHDAAVQTQGFVLPPPEGWPGHMPQPKPEGI